MRGLTSLYKPLKIFLRIGPLLTRTEEEEIKGFGLLRNLNPQLVLYTCSSALRIWD